MPTTKKTAAQLDSEIAAARMIGRHVKSGWHSLVDGEIVQWEPFGAALTDVLVRDVASGKLSWYASHGLKPIDGKGPLPSRDEAREVNRRTMEASLEKIREQHVRDWRRPWPGAEHGKAIVGRAIDGALTSVRDPKARHHSTRAAPIEVGQFVAWESPNTGATVKGRVQERQEIDGKMLLRIKIAGSPGDAIMPESAVRVLAKKH